MTPERARDEIEDSEACARATARETLTLPGGYNSRDVCVSRGYPGKTGGWPQPLGWWARKTWVR